MTFTWPGMLWALWGLLLLVWGALAAARRRRSTETRLADAHLFPRVVGHRNPWRARLPLALHLSAVALLVFAMARPVALVSLPVNRAAIVLAIDTSQSMMADDLKPSRLEAAKAAARNVLRALPRSVRVGLVAFSDVGTVLVPPSIERPMLEDALERLRPQQSTAVGSAVVEGLSILPGRREFLGERLARLRNTGPQDPLSPATPPGTAPPVRPDVGDLPPAVMILLSDGVSNTGVDPRVPATLAVEARVRIHAVGFGQVSGAVMPYGGRLVLVPFDPTSLQQLAQQTGGEYLRSSDEEGLRRLARQVGRAIGWERRRTELTAVFAGTAGLLMLAGAGLSLTWFRRLP